MKFARAISQGWNSFWFAPLEARPVDLFRRMLGLVILLSWLSQIPDLGFWYGPSGIVEGRASQVFSLLHWLPRTETSLLAVLVLICLGAIGMLLGIFPRFSALIAYLGILSFFSVDSLTWDGGDRLEMIFSFFLIFVPSTNRCPAWPVRLMQIQLSIVYLFTAIEKLFNPYWRDGTALHYAIQMTAFGRWRSLFLFQNPAVYHALTWGTLVFELSMVLIWVPRLRRKMLIAALLFHLGIALTMGIYLFEGVMISSLVLFMRDEDFELFAIGRFA